MELIRRVYCSAATCAMEADELRALLDVCRRKNAEVGVTGMLLYQSGSFFQVLEGDRAVVDALYERIEKDERHQRVTTILVEPIALRDFGEWTMGYPKVSARDLAQIPGLNDFFARGTSFLRLGKGRTKTLLAAFKEGRWRASMRP